MLEILFSFLWAYFLPGFFVSLALYPLQDWLARLVTSFAISTGLLMAIMVALASFATFSVESITAIELAIIAACAAYLAWRKPRLNLKLDLRWPRLSRLQALFLLIIIVGVCLRFYHAAAFPDTGWDSTTYHLSQEKIMAEQHKIPANDFIPTGYYFAWPQGAHLLASWFYIVNGFNDVFARLLTPVFGAMMLVGVYAFMRRWFSPSFGLTVAFFLSLIPLHIAQSMIAYTNIIEVFFSLLAVFAVYEALKQNRFSLFSLAGFFAGCAFLVKQTAAVAVLAVLAVLAWHACKNKKWSLNAKYFAVFLAFFFIVTSAWFGRNALVYNNPVYPYFSSVFGTGTYGLSQGDNPPQVMLASFFVDQQLNYNWGVGPYFLAFGLLGLLIAWRKHAFFSVAIAASLLIPVAFLREDARFIMLSIFLAVFFVAVGFEKMFKRWKAATSVLLALMVAFSMGLAVVGFKLPLQKSVLPLPMSEDSALRLKFGNSLVDAWLFLKTQTAQDASMMTMYLRGQYYHGRVTYQIPYTLKWEVSKTLEFASKNSVSYYMLEDIPLAAIPDEYFQQLEQSGHFTKVFDEAPVIIYKIIE